MTANRSIEDIYPLSPMQQGMLFHSLIAPDHGLYVFQLSCRLEGELDRPTFRRALERIVERHGILRTSFLWEDLDQPLQVVARQVAVPVAEEDWSGLEGDGQRERLEAYLAADLARGFDMRRPPLMRLLLAHEGRRRYRLVWSLHMLLLDGWSISAVIGQLFQCYEALRRGMDPGLGSPPRFRDYIAWLQRQDRAVAEGFWRRELAGFTVATPLPGDRGPVARPDPVRHTVRLCEETTAALQALARGAQVTLGTLIQGSWALLLARTTGERDVVFGVTVSGRPPDLPGVESMVGLFINTVPLRARVTDDAPLLGWLRDLQERQVESRQFEHIPLPDVQGWSEVVRKAQLFESLVVFENYPPGSAVEGEGNASLVLDDIGLANYTNYPLVLTAEPGARLALHIDSHRPRFGAAAPVLLAGFADLLERIARQRPERLGDLLQPTPPELQQLLHEWNDSGSEIPAGGAGLVEVFAARAAERPEAVAAVCGDQGVSYRDLAAGSERLARALAAEGAGPETRVALLAERGLDFLVAILGIFRAGGAYLPLDPRHPRQRLAALLAASGVELALADRRFFAALEEVAADLPASVRPRVRPLEELLAREGGREDGGEAALPGGDPDRLAYLIYTSGSTGVPKGVMVEHGGMLNHLWVKARDLGLGAGDVVAQTASQSFDISVWQFLAPLLAGGRVHVLPDEVAHDPRRLLEEVERHGITVLETVPSLLRLALEELERLGPRRPALSRLRWLIPTGEALPPELCHQWLRLYPGVPLLNAYGPTECSDDVTHHPICPGEEPERPPTPIGRPVANLRLYVLDGAGSPLPAGVAGELFVGGAGVGRGYLGDGARTAQAFLPDPFAARPGRRLYRTGDLARWRPDGRLEFLGRLDHQVKVRGHRIELGEIEAVLAGHPEVRAAVVTVREDAPGQTRLVAYVVPHRDRRIDVEPLRALTAERLPEWMVPAAWVLLDELPLTANGKLDRKALPAPEPARPATFGEDAAPRGPVEETLAAIWTEVLGVERVGAHDDFFALGGHSLLATQVVSRLRSAFAVELPLRVLFEEPTVAGLAARIGRERGAEQAPPIPPVPRDGVLPLSFPQQRLWFLDRLEPGSPLYNIPAALRLEGGLDRGLDVAALARALSEIVRRHEAVRTTFPAVDGEPVQVISPPSPHPLPVLDLSALPAAEREEETARRIAGEVTRPFDLAAGPLLRTLLLRLGGREHVLVLTAHHIVSDGWSTGVFVRELSILYAAFARGEGSPLPELPIQYADFAAWQRRWLVGERLARRLDAWRARLAGAPAALDLPTDRPRPAVQTFRGGRVAVRLEEAAGLRDLARGEGATLFMALLASFQTLLSRYTDQEDVVVGTPIAGRDRRELEGLIGVFINSLPLRGDLSGAPSFRELLGRAREAAFEAYALQDLPFEKLVEELRPARDLARSPLFQVMLVLQNAPAGPLALPDLTLSPLTTESRTTKFELTLTLAEAGDALEGNLDYNADLFDRATAERLVGHLATLAAAAAASPHTRAGELPLLTGRERGQLLREWNDTAAPLPAVCAHDLFAERAARVPEAVAVSAADGRSLTFGALDRRAATLARRLRALGVGPETRVGLALDRSLEMVVAVLGTLKAGGAYVPLDLSSPAERLAFVLEDSRAAVLLTRRGLETSLPHPAMEVLYVEDVADIGAEAPADSEPAGGAGPDDLAYVLYTSGSTGVPKGVMVPHRGLTNYLLWALRAYEPAAGRGAPVHSPLGFDLTVTSLFLPLLAGRTVFLLPEDRGVDGLAAALAEGGFGLVKLTPAHLDVLAELLPPEHAAGATRALVLGGEALAGEQLRLWAAQAPGTRVINEYGPTETVVGCCVHEQAAGDLAAGAVPIGRPIANTRLHLLDHGLQPVPAGVPGEICIAGAGLARGYAGRPGQTAERFIPDPFAARPGDRLYRTGDLARRRADGALEFLGRVDHQVKIRGHRIEPAEVEAVLCRHPSVAQAAVAAWGSAREDRRLAAWIVAAGGAVPDPAELRDHLRAVLPEPMVPSAWTVLAVLPLTANGKLDRAALPVPDRPAVAAAAYEEPRSAGERVIAEVWRDLLGADRVGLHDNFFDLGGHSLLMARVQSRLRERLGREIGMVDLFSHPTVASLAGWLSGTEDAAEMARQRERAERQAEREERGRSRLGRLRQQGRASSGGAR